MIISFRGTDISINNANAALALYAGMNAIKYNKRTFVLQLMTLFPIEDAMNGKERKERQFGVERSFNDSGMDALMLRASRQKISEDIIQATCESMLTQSGLLMVAEVSKIRNDEFERDCLAKQEDIAVLIARIQELYDDVFILLDGKNHELLDAMSPHINEEFICIPQGNNEPYHSSVEKSTFMVMDFDQQSAYNAKYIEKLYNVKNVALCPYNVRFKDALNTNSVLSFVIKNSKPSAYDDNAYFINCIFDVFKVVIGQEILETEDMYFPHMEAKYNSFDSYDESSDLSTRKELTHKNIVYDDDTKGFFGRLFGRKKKSNFEIVIDNGEIEKDEELITIEEAEEEGYNPAEAVTDDDDGGMSLDDFDEDDIPDYEEEEDDDPDSDDAPAAPVVTEEDDDDFDDFDDFDEIEEIPDDEPDEAMIVKIAENEDGKEAGALDGEEDWDPEELPAMDYSQLKPRELYDECVKRGMKVPKRKPSKFYIKKLEKYDEDEAWED